MVGRSRACQDVGMRKPSGMCLGEQLLLGLWQEPPCELPGSRERDSWITARDAGRGFTFLHLVTDVALASSAPCPLATGRSALQLRGCPPFQGLAWGCVEDSEQMGIPGTLPPLPARPVSGSATQMCFFTINMCSEVLGQVKSALWAPFLAHVRHICTFSYLHQGLLTSASVEV